MSSTAIDVPEDVIPIVSSYVGMIVIGWAFLESSLDAWSAIAFHNHGGSSVNKRLPMQFSEKCRFLEKCFNQLPSLSPVSTEALEIISRATSLSAIRNYVSHGTLSHFDPLDQSFKFIKIGTSSDKKQYVLGELRIVSSDLEKAGLELVQIGTAAQEVTQRLLSL